MQNHAAQAYPAHTNSYVVKPADFTTFTELINDLASYWLAWNYHPWS